MKILFLDFNIVSIKSNLKDDAHKQTEREKTNEIEQGKLGYENRM